MGEQLISLVSLDQIEKVLGDAASRAKKMAADKVSRMDTLDDGSTLLSLKVPQCVTVLTDFEEAVMVVRQPSDLEDTVANKRPMEALAEMISLCAATDTEVLTAAEEEISKMEEMLMADHAKIPSSRDIMKHRKMLLTLKQRYEQLEEIGESLLLQHGASKELYDWKSRASRMSRAVKDVRELLSDVRDAYQSAIQVRQNKLMQIFTLIAAVFMPLQLITGWYGMNLILPEFSWRYTYPVLIAVCAGLVVTLLIYFRRKKWL